MAEPGYCSAEMPGAEHARWLEGGWYGAELVGGSLAPTPLECLPTPPAPNADINAWRINSSEAKSSALIDYASAVDQYNAKCWTLTSAAGE